MARRAIGAWSRLKATDTSSSTSAAVERSNEIEARREKSVFAFLLFFGSLFAFVTPPFQVPDEPVHFYRAFEVSEGRLVANARGTESGDLLPESLPRTAERLIGDVPFHAERKLAPSAIPENLHVPLEPGRRVFVAFLTTAYSFVTYLPPALGILAGRVCGGTVLVLLYCGRLASVLVCAWFLSRAIRISPVGKPVFFLLAVAPMAMFEMASLSADAFTNAFCFLFIAVMFREIFGRNDPLVSRDVVPLALLSIVLGLTKPGYVVLPALFLLVPSRRGGSIARRIGITASLMLASAAALAVWTWIIWRIDPRLGHRVPLDPWRQVAGMLRNPFGFLKMSAAFYVREAGVLANQYVGKLGWIDTHLPKAFIVGFILVLLGVAATCGRSDIEMKRSQRIGLFGIFAVSILWMTTLLYVLLTPFGAQVVGSTQGRYFIPFGPLGFLLLYNRRFLLPWEMRPGLLLAWGAFTEVLALVSIVRRFYL